MWLKVKRFEKPQKKGNKYTRINVKRKLIITTATMIPSSNWLDPTISFKGHVYRYSIAAFNLIQRPDRHSNLSIFEEWCRAHYRHGFNLPYWFILFERNLISFPEFRKYTQVTLLIYVPCGFDISAAWISIFVNQFFVCNQTQNLKENKQISNIQRNSAKNFSKENQSQRRSFPTLFYRSLHSINQFNSECGTGKKIYGFRDICSAVIFVDYYFWLIDCFEAIRFEHLTWNTFPKKKIE